MSNEIDTHTDTQTQIPKRETQAQVDTHRYTDRYKNARRYKKRHTQKCAGR